MSNQRPIREAKARAITYKVICGIVKHYGEATVPEVRAKYKTIAKPWNLPFDWLTEESVIAYLNQGVRNGVLGYERRRKGQVIEKRLRGEAQGTGYYFWLDEENSG